jgi:hypothetical protein
MNRNVIFFLADVPKVADETIPEGPFCATFPKVA